MSLSPQQQIESIVRSLEEKGVPAVPVVEATNLATSHPEAVSDLAIEVMRRFPKGGTFLDWAFGSAQMPRRWFWQAWGCSNSRENLNRVGGEPSWIQDAEYPSCPSCDKLMPYLFQLDSDLPTAGGGEWLWGSGGIAYGFWCDGCRISGVIWQCT